MPFLAGQFGDEDMKTITSEMVDGVAIILQFWFNPKDGYESGNFVDDYFYYHEDLRNTDWLSGFLQLGSGGKRTIISTMATGSRQRQQLP